MGRLTELEEDSLQLREAFTNASGKMESMLDFGRRLQRTMSIIEHQASDLILLFQLSAWI
jgi:hypothetical protein